MPGGSIVCKRASSFGFFTGRVVGVVGVTSVAGVTVATVPVFLTVFGFGLRGARLSFHRTRFGLRGLLGRLGLGVRCLGARCLSLRLCGLRRLLFRLAIATPLRVGGNASDTQRENERHQNG